MNAATYSLLTLRPDAERVDLLCVGAVIRDVVGTWYVLIPPSNNKIQALGTSQDRLATLGRNLTTLLGNCAGFEEARMMLDRIGGSMKLHDFQGVFAYATDAEFNAQAQAIVRESVLPPTAPTSRDPVRARPVRPHTRARLRQQFESMGILGKNTTEITEHKVVRNFPISAQHGLTAEFALKNTVMHITETVDFEVAEDSVRGKQFEAQAKCLVLRTARDTFGVSTECYVVISGGGSRHASRAVDLLSTSGRLFSTESATDMANYLDRIAQAAHSTGQLN